jgi:uncharacterized RDD family membrane protein YckC
MLTMPLRLRMFRKSSRAVFQAGMVDRGLAKLIDLLLIFMCMFVVDLTFGTSFVVLADPRRGHTPLEVCLTFLVFCLYSAILESSRWQATVGKRVIGIIVTDLADRRISFGQAFVRSAAQIFGLAYVAAPFTRQKQGLHDLVAATLVIPGTT